MKKYIIIISVVLVLALAATVIYARRDVIPAKIDTMNEFSDIFGMLVSRDCIVEEYSRSYSEDGSVYTDLCYKLDMAHEKTWQADDKTYLNDEVSEDMIPSVNELLPADKPMGSSDIVSHGFRYATFSYVGIPGIYEWKTTQLVFWYNVTEDGHEYVYLYTSVPRAYSAELSD